MLYWIIYKTMKRMCYVVYALLLLCGSLSLGFAQNDVMDTIFQPSKNLDHIIVIGNSKNSVGNEVFRESKGFDAHVGEGCFWVAHPSEDNCSGNFRKAAHGKCYVIPATTHNDHASCQSFGGEWVSLTYAAFSNRAPLLVRITQTLLRLTIALAIPVLIFIGVKLIKGAMDGASVSEAFKQVSHVLIGLVLALSALGIVYFIQIIAMNTISF